MARAQGWDVDRTGGRKANEESDVLTLVVNWDVSIGDLAPGQQLTEPSSKFGTKTFECPVPALRRTASPATACPPKFRPVSSTSGLGR